MSVAVYDTMGNVIGSMKTRHYIALMSGVFCLISTMNCILQTFVFVSYDVYEHRTTAGEDEKVVKVKVTNDSTSFCGVSDGDEDSDVEKVAREECKAHGVERCGAATLGQNAPKEQY